MPFDRGPKDGKVSVFRMAGDDLLCGVEHDGHHSSFVCTPYNAARLIAMLCVMIEVSIPRELRKLKM